MSANELFEVTLMLWGSVAGLFVLAGFISGEWVDRYRDLRDWINERRDNHSEGSQLPPNQPLPRAS